MDECPHCGEPISGSSESCPHCGSDAETGWNPDVEYLGVELPHDELFEIEMGGARGENGRRVWGGIAWSLLIGYALIVVAAAGFFIHARAFAEPVSLLTFVLLVISFLVAGAQVRAQEDARRF